MPNAHRIWAGLLATVGGLTMGLSSCVSGPTDQPEDIGTTTEAVGGAVGDWSGFTDGQCVHGVYSFYHARFGVTLTGTCASPTTGNCETCGACEIWKGAAVEPPATLFNKYTWGTTMPQLYDIVVYPPKTAAVGPGHVACVDHIDSTNPSDWQAMYVMDSNWYGNEKMATSVHTVTRAPYGIFRLKSLDNPPAKGFLDVAACDAVGGWTQDPSHPTQAINADLYFNAPKGDAAAIKAEIVAGIDRSDLCTPLGSCNHGYSMPTPRGAMDGVEHKVYAYGVDGGSDTLLKDAPKSFTCTPPPIANVAKRALSGADVFTAWNFQTFFDVAVYAQADVDAVVTGADEPATPSLIQVDGQDEIDVIDGTERRAIADMASFANWRFTKDMVKTVQATDLTAYTVGAAWPTAPLLIQSTAGDTVYVLDGELPATPPTDTTSGTTDGAGGSTSSSGDGTNIGGGDNGSGSSKGCSIGDASKDRPETAWAVLAVAGIAIARRRRAR